MSTQNDLLDGNDSNLERLSDEAPEQSDMCLNWQDDVDNNFPNYEPDAYRSNCGYLSKKKLSSQYTLYLGYGKIKSIIKNKKRL